MKKLLIVLIVLMLSFGAGTSFASGDKNHGTKGKGTTSTGTSSQGAATQTRAGR